MKKKRGGGGKEREGYSLGDKLELQLQKEERRRKKN